MNCYAFKSEIPISVSGSFSVSFTDYYGEPVYTDGTFSLKPSPSTPRRAKACRTDDLNYGRLSRRGIYWNRFWVDGLAGFQAYEITESGNMNGISVGGGYPRPWNSADPFYARAASMWDSGRIALEITNNQPYYSTNLRFGFSAYYGMFQNVSGDGLFKDGETIDIKNGYDVVGQLTLSVS